MIETKLSSDLIYSGRVVELRVDKVQLPNGREASREVVNHVGAVAVIAVTDAQEILLIRQYRYPVEEILWEIPAGKLEPNEYPEACAHRELAEETGYGAKKWEYLNTFFTTPGFSNEIMHLFLAKDLYKHNLSPDDDELIEVHTIKLSDAEKMIYSGQIKDAKTILGILLSKNKF